MMGAAKTAIAAKRRPGSCRIFNVVIEWEDWKACKVHGDNNVGYFET